MKAIAILVNKIVYLIGKFVGKGTTMPGKIARKIDRNILKKIKLPDHVIVVTGSNGKTTTVEMIDSVLSENGFKVACNIEGSNLIEGVTTMILNNCSLSGKMHKDVLLIESDERYLRHTLKEIRATDIVITNLSRDQMCRNGHPEHIYDIIKDAITDDVHLILNADDPLSSLYGYNRENVTYFGMNENELSTKECTSIYDDGKYCPNCKQKMQYEYYHYNNVGSYKCTSCGHERKNPNYAITSFDFKAGEITINQKNKLALSLRSVYNAYNILATYTVAKLLNVDDEKIVSSLSNYNIKNDRIQTFNVGEKEVTLLTSKHENPISYNQSLLYLTRENEKCTVVILLDEVSRRYFTVETAWIWDIDYELLNSDCVKEIILGGRYVHDLVSRMEVAGISKSKITACENFEEVSQNIQNKTVGKIYMMTSFMDRKNFKNSLKQSK